MTTGPRLAGAAALAMALAGGPAGGSEPMPRLMGTVITGSDRVALFEGRPTLLVHEGELVGRERVVVIGAGSVRLEGPSGPRIAIVSGDPRLAPSPAPQPTIVDPYWRERESETDQ